MISKVSNERIPVFIKAEKIIKCISLGQGKFKSRRYYFISNFILFLYKLYFYYFL